MSGRGRWLLVLVAVAAVTVHGSPASAAGSPIPIVGAAGLELPSRLVPPLFSESPSQSYAMSNVALTALAGKTISALFRDHGLIAGYHSVLNGPISPGAQFVVANYFGFQSNAGALAARTAYHRLITGTTVIYPTDTLPRSAVVWTYAGTTSKRTAYIAARIVFRIANVVGDVTGFYLGTDNAAATMALSDAAAQVRAYAHWIAAQLPPAKQRSSLPLLPLAIAPFMRFGKAR